MSVSKSVTVTTSPTMLYQADGPNPETVTVDVLSGSDVTLGGPTVVAGQGPQEKTTSPPWVGTLYEDSVYGVVATGTASVEVFAVISGSR
jgi:hypothetical protein